MTTTEWLNGSPKEVKQINRHYGLGSDAFRVLKA